jgi:thioredoxin 1
MQSSSTKPSRAPIYIGLLFVAGAVALSRGAPSCPLGSWMCEKTPATTTNTGEENMSIATSKQIQHANETNFDSLVLKSEVPVLVDFYADWCGPCRRLAPILEDLAGETPDARIVKINVEDSPNLAAKYGVDSIPSLKVFKRGVVVDQFVGLANKQQLKSLITR